MKNNVFIYIVLLVLPLGLRAQSGDLIDSLEYILFEKDVRPEGYTYRFYSHMIKDSFTIRSSYPDDYTYHKEPQIVEICDSIRRLLAHDQLPRLREILERQESLFRAEWEPSRKHNVDGLWSDQYDVLCTIDLTIGFLEIIQEEWSGAKVYEYAKNLYMLNHGDYDSTRIHKTVYNSPYIRNVRKYCQCKLMWPSSTHAPYVVDDLLRFAKREEIILSLLADLSSVEYRPVAEGEEKFFASGIRYFIESVNDDRLDSIVIHNPMLLVKAGYTDAVDHWAVDYPIDFYHLVGARYRVSKNPMLLDVILDDIFSSVDVLTDESTRFMIGKAMADHLGIYKVLERYIDIIRRTENDVDLGRIIDCILKELRPSRRSYLLYMADKSYTKGLLSKPKLDRMRRDIHLRRTR